MGNALIVTKSHDENFHETGNEIAREEWLDLVNGDADLRLRTEPETLKNPKTNQTISIQPLPGQTELRVGMNWVPFLGYRAGKLVMGFGNSLTDETNPVRHKVAEVARKLGAIITHDAGDEVFKW